MVCEFLLCVTFDQNIMQSLYVIYYEIFLISVNFTQFKEKEK